MLNVYDAVAELKGSKLAPDLHGTVKFFKVADGTWVEAEVFGLPEFKPQTADSLQVGPFAFHIHENISCGSIFADSPFSAAGGHWNPDGQPHGNHAGDFPVLFSNDGTAKMLFFTNRFFPQDVIGRTVVIHNSPDAYTMPPSPQNKRIACGAIVSAQETI